MTQERYVLFRRWADSSQNGDITDVVSFHAQVGADESFARFESNPLIIGQKIVDTATGETRETPDWQIEWEDTYPEAAGTHVAVAATQGLAASGVEANTNLIVAAPDMHGALASFPADADFASSEEYARAISVWWSTKAMPALAKAEGRS